MRSFCCTSKHRLPYHYRCPKCQDQLPGEANPPVGRSQEKLPRALNLLCFSWLRQSRRLSLTVTSAVQALKMWPPRYWIDCLNLSLKKKERKKKTPGILRGCWPNNIKAKGNQWKQAIDSTPSWMTDTVLAAHLTQGGPFCQSGFQYEWRA